MKYLLLLVFALNVTAAHAFEFKTQQVSHNIYALIGDTGPRTSTNFGSNNTVGFIVTKDGVILVSSGAMPAGAKLIDLAIQKETSQPIKWVINIGAQDHHWMGNSYFAEKGAEIIAMQRTINTQKQNLANHLDRLNSVLHEKINTIKPVYASRVLSADNNALNLGGTQVELIWPGNGHFPGDGILWVAEQQVLFTGDFVYHDRILGIHPTTPVIEWHKAVQKFAALKPKHIIPGHGVASDLKQTQAQTIDYLNMLVEGVTAAIQDWQELDETINHLSDAPQYNALKNFDSWHRRNIHQAYMQIEAAQ